MTFFYSLSSPNPTLLSILINWLAKSVEVYHVILFLPKNCLVFWKKQPWVSLADVTLLVGVHKYLLNFWFTRVEDCYIRVSQNQKWGPSDFCLKRALLCHESQLLYILLYGNHSHCLERKRAMWSWQYDNTIIYFGTFLFKISIMPANSILMHCASWWKIYIVHFLLYRLFYHQIHPVSCDYVGILYQW